MRSTADLLCTQLPLQAVEMFHVKGLPNRAIG